MALSRFLIKNEKFLSVPFPKTILLLLAVVFFAYTCLRAHFLSMTHDESGSFTLWAEYPIFSCFVDPYCWQSANLHFIYVLLMKGTVGVFGVSELAIRMPSLLGHLIYLFFSWKLVKMWTNKSWLILCGFLIINCNPFLLEFFSLGRGYGLANAFMMMSIYYMGLYFKTNKKGAAWGMYGGAFLAVLSNFTMLNYYACMTGGGGLVFLYLLFKKEKIDWRFWLHLFIAGVVVTATLFSLIYMPITNLSSGGEFEYGASSFWQTFSSNVKSSLYSIKYMSAYHVEILGSLFVAMLTTGIIIAYKNLIKTKNKKAQFYFIASLLPLLVALASVVQHYLMGVNYLRGRTALVFVPLTSVALFLFFENILSSTQISFFTMIEKFSQKKIIRPWKGKTIKEFIHLFLPYAKQLLIFLKKEKDLWRLAIPFVVGIFCTVHIFRSYQLTQSYEWWFDSRTKDMIEYMASIVPEGEKVKLGMHWLFHPTSRFYYENVPYDFAETLKYEKNYRTDDFYDYYYINFGEEDKISKRYKVKKEFPWVGVLMVRDSL